MSLLINHYYRFREFTLDADQRVLLQAGKPVALPPKVFDTLLVLVENSGRIVTKEELMRRLWPDTFVEETNLTYNIKHLRKSLGDDARRPHYIETVARRGYRFVADVEENLGGRAEMSDLIARRFDAANARPPDFDNRLSRPAETPAPGPAASANEGRPAMAEKVSSALPAPGRVFRVAGKKSVALRAGLIVVLAGAGLLFREFSNGPNKPSSEDNKVDVRARAASPLRLERLTATGQSRQVAISPDGRYIAYTREYEGKCSIWLRQLATNTNVEIVPPTGAIYGLAFANGGEYLFFVKRVAPVAGPLLYRTALYRVSVLGGVPTKIVDQLSGKFSISADDSQVAFIRQAINPDGQREYSLMVVNSDGTGERTLLVGTHPNDLKTPVWSPDGQSIICAYGSSDGGGQNVSIVAVRAADGMKRELSSDRFFLIEKMAWLPDKSGLFVSARKDLAHINQLWRVSYPGMEISQVTEDLIDYLDLSVASGADRAVASQATRISDVWAGSSREPRSLKRITQAIDKVGWTPDGRLVYSSTASGSKDLWVMRPDGTQQKQLTASGGVNVTPAVTPDGRYVVFLSNRTGAFQIWRMDIDGSNQIQLTSGAAKDCPAISPDGKWVLYNTTDDWHLWRVPIDGGESVRLTAYLASRPSVSPDGKTIACIGRTESKARILILPFEGGQPLKTFDFAGSSSRLQWSEDGKALFCAIERDGLTVLIKQPLAGGRPQAVIDFGEDQLFDFGYSFDGQQLAVTRGRWQHDVVLISGLNRY